MEQTKETWGEIPNEPCDFPLECEHGSTGRCDKCGIETWGETRERFYDYNFKWVDLEDGNGKYLYHEDVLTFIEKEISSAVQKERERIEKEIRDKMPDYLHKYGKFLIENPHAEPLIRRAEKNNITAEFLSALNERDITDKS